VQRSPDIAVEIRHPAVARDRLANEIDGCLVVTGRVCNDPQKMQAVGVVGIGRKDLSVKRLRLAKPPGLVMPTALLQGPIGV
jgi:hypothetical protein